jgi:D-glycero-D-manno-heptose 1,7-bisphosphate phosphatase
LRKAAFLDLNGTLVLPLKQERLNDLVPIPGAIDAVARLSRAGFACPVVTVQSRIAKGLFTTADFFDWFATFAAAAREQGADLQGPYVCPHRYAESCACKKPNPMLYERAILDLGIAPAESFVIGDSPDDIRAAVRLGARGCLVRTGWASDPTVAATVEAQASLVAPSIVEAVDWILSGRCESIAVNVAKTSVLLTFGRSEANLPPGTREEAHGQARHQ